MAAKPISAAQTDHMGGEADQRGANRSHGRRSRSSRRKQITWAAKPIIAAQTDHIGGEADHRGANRSHGPRSRSALFLTRISAVAVSQMICFSHRWKQ